MFVRDVNCFVEPSDSRRWTKVLSPAELSLLGRQILRVLSTTCAEEVIGYSLRPA